MATQGYTAVAFAQEKTSAQYCCFCCCCCCCCCIRCEKRLINHPWSTFDLESRIDSIRVWPGSHCGELPGILFWQWCLVGKFSNKQPYDLWCALQITSSSWRWNGHLLISGWLPLLDALDIWPFACLHVERWGEALAACMFAGWTSILISSRIPDTLSVWCPQIVLSLHLVARQWDPVQLCNRSCHIYSDQGHQDFSVVVCRRRPRLHRLSSV